MTPRGIGPEAVVTRQRALEVNRRATQIERDGKSTTLLDQEFDVPPNAYIEFRSKYHPHTDRAVINIADIRNQIKVWRNYVYRGEIDRSQEPIDKTIHLAINALNKGLNNVVVFCGRVRDIGNYGLPIDDLRTLSSSDTKQLIETNTGKQINITTKTSDYNSGGGIYLVTISVK